MSDLATTVPVTHLDITLPSNGEVVTLKKMKAGAFYAAKEAFITQLQKSQEAYANAVGKEALQKMIEAGDKITEKELEKMQKNANLNATLEVMKTGFEEKMAVVALSLGKDVSVIAEEYYEEDVEALFQGTVTLHNFLDAQKK